MQSNSYKTAIKECVKFVEKSKQGYFKDDKPYEDELGEDGTRIRNEKFFAIPDCDDIRELGFVDGGTGPLLRSADFNISLNRVAGVKFSADKWVSLKKAPEKIEFYSATVLDALDSGALAYKSKFFPIEPRFSEYLPKNLPGDTLTFNLNDGSVRKQGYGLPSIEMFGAVTMRFAEWTYATKFIEEEMNEGGIFVRDGSLHASYTTETKYSNNLYQTAIKNEVTVTGLSKTCRLFTKSGNSLNSAVNYFGNLRFPENKWYFHPILKITKAQEKADLFFVKLHKNSNYSFRFDILLKQSEKMTQEELEVIISNLAENSTDLSYPGYPYGLIKVDQLAAVRYKELEHLKMQIMTEFSPDNYTNYILPRLRSVDAHDLLNIIRK
jgi:hypothetical protein